MNTTEYDDTRNSKELIALLFPDLHHLRTKDFIYQVPKVELCSKKPMRLTFIEGSAHDVDLMVWNESS